MQGRCWKKVRSTASGRCLLIKLTLLFRASIEGHAAGFMDEPDASMQDSSATLGLNFGISSCSSVAFSPEPGAQMDGETFIAKRIDDLNQNIRSLITIYMTWFTFYWTLNSGALAWFWSKGSGGSGPPSPPHLILWFFGIMALPSGVSSFFVLKAVMDMRRETVCLYKQLLKLIPWKDGSPFAVLSTPAWPNEVTWWGLTVNGLTTFALGVVWIVLAYRS